MIKKLQCLFRGHEDVKVMQDGRLAVQCHRCLRVSPGLVIPSSASTRLARKSASASAATTSARCDGDAAA